MKCVAVTQEGGVNWVENKMLNNFPFLNSLLLVLDESDDGSSQAQVSIQWCGAWCEI